MLPVIRMTRVIRDHAVRVAITAAVVMIVIVREIAGSCR